MKNKNLKTISLILAIILLSISSSKPIAAQETISITASGRGNPFINFTDGKSLADNTSNLSASGATKSAAAASADFDADGVPDLAIAYRTENGGLISIRRGNLESIFPKDHDAQPSPFLPFSLSPLLDLPFAPDYLAAGDFNADGKQDLLAAKIGATNLVLRAGLGNGDFAAPQTIELGGNLTAFATGEMNNFDNLADVAVGIMEKDGARILIFQNRAGAFSAKPETLEVKKAVFALVFGELDAHTSHDLIAAAGDELVFVSGSVGGKIEDKNVSRRKVNFQIAALAVGDFVGERENEVALLSNRGELFVEEKLSTKTHEKNTKKNFVKTSCSFVDANSLIAAKVSTRQKSDLIIGGANSLNIVTGDGADNLSVAAMFDGNENPVAVLPMRLNKDALNDLVVLTENKSEPTILLTAPMQILTVTSTANSGANTLRGAIEAANNSAGLDEVRFNISDPNATIVAESAFSITEAITLDATTQPGYAGQPVVAVRGDTSIYFGGGNSVTRGFVNNSTNAFLPAIEIDGAGNVFVEGSFLGTDRDGIASGGTPNAGVFINESSGNTIGGTVAQARNVVSGIVDNGSGMIIQGAGAGSNRIKGNYIGTDKTGLLALGNYGSGILIETAASGNVIGGATDGERNIISASGANLPGNPGIGVKISLPMNTFSNVVVENNFIGTNKDGNAALGNLGGGVRFEYNAGGNPTAAAQFYDNVISGNTGDGFYAVNIAAPLLNAAPQGGVGEILILGRRRSSLSASPEVATPGNRIGTNAAGTAALPNTGNGVSLQNATATIEGNIISANGANGIKSVAQLSATRFSQIADNYIGVDASGANDLGNTGEGINLEFNGTAPTTFEASKIWSNIISGNGGDGVKVNAQNVSLSDSNLNSPQLAALFYIDMGARRTNFNANAPEAAPTGNRIGTNAAGTAAVPNNGNGINLINATALVENNLISGNGASGIKLKAPASATRFNQIADNYIGTDLSGNVRLGNSSDGITFEFGTVAQNQAKSRIWSNVVSGNNGDGVRVFRNAAFTENAAPELAALFFVDVGRRPAGSLNASPEVVPQGNLIGTNAAGTAALGNSGNGVSISNVPTNIGSETPADGNVIAYNGANGVVILSGTNNFIRSNSIFSNTLLDVDLGDDGVTPNDLLDADTGANGLQNYPTLATANSIGANVQIAGAFNSKPNNPYMLVFYSTASCVGSKSLAAQNQIGNLMVTTDAAGNANINSSFAASVPAGQFIIANAIDFNPAPAADDNTSEFSPCVVVGGPTPTGTVSGRVTYANAPTTTGVPFTTITAAGSIPLSTMTDANGFYSISGFGSGAYTITPSKANQVNGISNLDASRIAQHIVGLTVLNANQLIAADTSGNGSVSSLDASYIAQFVASIANPSITGTWKFLPASRSYPNIMTNQSNQDFSAILVGDVTGNWNPSGMLRSELSGLENGLTTQTDKSEKMVGVTAQRNQSATEKAALTVNLTATETTGKDILGYQFDLLYDAEVITPQAIGCDVSDTISRDLTAICHVSESGVLKVVVFGATPLSGQGTLLKLNFKVVGATGSTSRLRIENFMFNEETPQAVAIDEQVSTADSTKQ